MKEFPEEELTELWNAPLFQDWVFESNKISLEEVYTKLENNNRVFSKEHLDSLFKLLKRRLVLAGYRLATVLDRIYEKQSALCVEEKKVKKNENKEDIKLEKKEHANEEMNQSKNFIVPKRKKIRKISKNKLHH